MSFCFVSWEVNLDLIDCCTSDMGRTDTTLWLASFLTVFEHTLMGFVVVNLKKKNKIQIQMFQQNPCLILKLFSSTSKLEYHVCDSLYCP